MLPVDLAQTFAIGQRLQGEVVRLVPQGSVLVNVGGQPVLLTLAQQVVPGQILSATVAQISPALLLQLTDELPLSLPAETTFTRSATTVMAQVQRAAEALEFQQLSNQFALQEQWPLVLPLMHPFASPSQTMQLVIDREGYQEGRPTAEQEHYTVALSLDPSALGPLHIAAAVRGSAVSATFRVATPAVAEFLRAALPDLHARLQTLGFTSCVACAVQETAPQGSEGYVPRALTRAVKLVNIKV